MKKQDLKMKESSEGKGTLEEKAYEIFLIFDFFLTFFIFLIFLLIFFQQSVRDFF